MMYEGDAPDVFVIYDDYRDSGENGITTRSVVTDGNQTGARNIAPYEVSSRATERLAGRPRGSLNRRIHGRVNPTRRRRNIRKKRTWGG